MQSGFNTNIRHHGVLFHVQTEDSGAANPHVITHLFHGGNIMASRKREYSEHVGAADVEDVVRGLMEAQHKEMLKGLRAGEHDDAILVRVRPDLFDGAASEPEPEANGTSDGRDTESTLPPNTPPPGGGGAVVQATPQQRLARAFGDAVVSEKPLDEVVLDYLVENARKRKQRAK